MTIIDVMSPKCRTEGQPLRLLRRDRASNGNYAASWPMGGGFPSAEFLSYASYRGWQLVSSALRLLPQLRFVTPTAAHTPTRMILSIPMTHTATHIRG